MTPSASRSIYLATSLRTILTNPAPRLRLRLAPSQLLCRRHATTSNRTTETPGSGGPGGTDSKPPSAKRRAVTPFNDDGRVPWSQLSVPEKLGRTTQQSFNYGLIAVGLALTVGVGYLLYTEVFAPESKIRQFNRAVSRVKKDYRCTDVLGDPKKIVAHGDESAWASPRRVLARPIMTTMTTDAKGQEHLRMRFHVDGPKNNGIVHLYMSRRNTGEDFEYRYLYLEVPGHERIYLENNEHGLLARVKPMRWFGVKWK